MDEKAFIFTNSYFKLSLLREYLKKNASSNLIDMDQMMTHANCQNPISFRTHESMGLMWVYHAVCICGLEVRIND